MKRRTALGVAAALAATTHLASDSPLMPSSTLRPDYISATKPTSLHTRQIFLSASHIRCTGSTSVESAAITSIASSETKKIEQATLTDSVHYLSAFQKAPEYFAPDKSPETATLALAALQMNLQVFPMRNCDPQNPYGNPNNKIRVNRAFLALALTSEELPREMRSKLQKIQDNLKSGSEERYLETLAQAQEDKITTAQEIFTIIAAERDMTDAVNEVTPVMLEQTALMLDRIGIHYTSRQLKAVASGVESSADNMSRQLKILEALQELQQRGGQQMKSPADGPIIS